MECSRGGVGDIACVIGLMWIAKVELFKDWHFICPMRVGQLILADGELVLECVDYQEHGTIKAGVAPAAALARNNVVELAEVVAGRPSRGHVTVEEESPAEEVCTEEEQKQY